MEEHLTKIHQITYSGKKDVVETTKFSCTKCNFWAPNQSYLRMHMKDKHPKPRKTKIPKSIVWNHFSRSSTTRVQCNYCGKTYVSENSTTAMRVHLMREHKEKVPEMKGRIDEENFAGGLIFRR